MTFDGDTAATVTNWTMDSSITLLDSTSLGNTDQVIGAYGIRTTTGSGTAHYDASDPLVGAIIALIISTATPEAAVLRLETVATSAGYTGSAWIGSCSLGVAVDGLQSFTFSFTYSEGVTAIS